MVMQSIQTRITRIVTKLTKLKPIREIRVLAHFNQRHHGVLQSEALGLKFFWRGGRSDTVRPIDQHAYFGKWPGHNEPVPTSQPPTARIFQIHWHHGSARFLCEKNDARPEFVCGAARTVRSDHHIATGREYLRELEDCARAQPRTRTTNHIVAETLNGVRQQIAAAAGADQCGAMPLRKKTAQD